MRGGIGSGSLNFDEMVQAFTDALNAAGGGGGGGGGLQWPDSITTGSGLLVIPVGFNAIVRVNCNAGQTFSINGSGVLGSSLSSWDALAQTSSPLTVSYLGRRHQLTVPVNVSGETGLAGLWNNSNAKALTNGSQTYFVPEGNTIQGGSYAAELYAI